VSPVSLRRAAPADASGIARVHVDSWRTTYAGIFSDEYLRSLSYAKREELWCTLLGETGQVTVVAEVSDEILGFVNGGPNRGEESDFSAELYAIYLLAAHQRRGTGARLVHALSRALGEVGHRTMIVWVLRDNLAACRFYEALGGVEVGAKRITAGPRSLEEVAYGWSRLPGGEGASP
jgi:L-amino acid N-acyltransferase YncA